LSPLPAGESTVVRLGDEVSGMDYAVPCVVEWGIEGSPSAMALRVDGAPTRMIFVEPEALGWGSAIGWVASPSVSAE
jgi:hypothetical protein